MPAPEASLAASTSSASWGSPGSGCRSATVAPASSASSRSTPSSRRISVSPARAVSPISANRCAPAAGSPGVVSRAVSACTATMEIWCATTSCSSLAIRARSPRAVCASIVSASASPAAVLVRASRRARTAIPAPAAAGPPHASSTAASPPRPASASTRNGTASTTPTYGAPARAQTLTRRAPGTRRSQSSQATPPQTTCRPCPRRPPGRSGSPARARAVSGPSALARLARLAAPVLSAQVCREPAVARRRPPGRRRSAARARPRRWPRRTRRAAARWRRRP